jgi:ribosomal protein L11 methyltransferase
LPNHNFCKRHLFCPQTPTPLNFIELKLTLPPDWTDIFIAELAEIGYESFVEFDEGVLAYVPKSAFSDESWQAIVEKYRDAVSVAYQFVEIEQRNWNAEWEKNYEPIFIGDQCVVRTTFHQIGKSYPYEIIINPQMSFGTGHHETTTLMLENQLVTNHQGQRVMDAGCGTGILAIMASKRGAAQVDAFDIDEWAVTNTEANLALNGCANISIQRGTVATAGLADCYDTILANINRNILLAEMPLYASKLAVGGRLLLSGFYERDMAELEKAAQMQGLNKLRQSTKNEWACLLFGKARANPSGL